MYLFLDRMSNVPNNGLIIYKLNGGTSQKDSVRHIIMSGSSPNH